MTKFRYEPGDARLGAGHGGMVRLDEQDVAELVTRVTIDHKAGDVPRVFLELRPGVDVDAVEADVVATVVTQEADGAAIAEWLGHLDPAQLEADVLEEFGAFTEMTTGKACLAVLGRWARGANGDRDRA